MKKARDRGLDVDHLQETYTACINKALEAKPADMTITTHVCRGNFRSTFISSGGYEPVAQNLLAKCNYDGYFLEYDTDRAGGFEPLRFLPKGNKIVVLGLVTSKSGRLEPREDIKKRIQEATKYVALDQLCLSPQCGFASTEEGNVLAEDEQWAKLKMIVELAERSVGQIDRSFPRKREIAAERTGSPLSRGRADRAGRNHTMTQRTTPPFRADMVGSLLRPAPLKEARAKFAKGEIAAAALKEIEDREIEKIIKKQAEVGLKLATDGEFRRSWWHFDFFRGLKGVTPITTSTGIKFHGVETKHEAIRIDGKVDFAGHPHDRAFQVPQERIAASRRKCASRRRARSISARAGRW